MYTAGHVFDTFGFILAECKAKSAYKYIIERDDSAQFRLRRIDAQYHSPIWRHDMRE